MVAGFFSFLMELLTEGILALGEKTSNKQRKELFSQVTCPLCKKEKLTINYFCPNCDTHILYENDIMDNNGKITKLTCKSCGFIYKSSDLDEFCPKCGEPLNS